MDRTINFAPVTQIIMQKMKVCVGMLLFAALLFVRSYAKTNNDDITEEKAGDMFNCICVISCDLGNVFELERVLDKATPDLQERILQWYGDCYSMDFKTSRQFFDIFYETVCPVDVQKKRECFKKFMISFGNHMEKICGDEFDADECAGAERVTEEFKLLISEYTLKGDCYNPEGLKKKTIQDGSHTVTGY